MSKKHPYLQAALLCEGVETDASGRYTIKKEFSQYTMGYSQRITVFTIWRGAQDENNTKYYQKTEIVAPDGRVVAAGENEYFSLKDATHRQVNSIIFDNVDFTHDGKYELQVGLYSADNSLIDSHNYPILVV